MQGYVLHVRRAKNEDLIVTLLTPERLVSGYRFYGARHSILTPGFKIDFELVRATQVFMPQLRHLSHLGFKWLIDREALGAMQQFVALLYTHLRDVEAIDRFYFALLDEAAKRLGRQNPRRVMVETYLRLLAFEGRLHAMEHCYVCGEAIEEELTLIRAFVPAHKACAFAPTFAQAQIAAMAQTHSTIHLDNATVEQLYRLILEGL